MLVGHTIFVFIVLKSVMVLSNFCGLKQLSHFSTLALVGDFALVIELSVI
jgi:hypothetical protein